jgi:hypothetical protein
MWFISNLSRFIFFDFIQIEEFYKNFSICFALTLHIKYFCWTIAYVWNIKLINKEYKACMRSFVIMKILLKVMTGVKISHEGLYLIQIEMRDIVVMPYYVISSLSSHHFLYAHVIHDRFRFLLFHFIEKNYKYHHQKILYL